MPTTPGHLPPKVIIIGAGIAGPILAIFLKCHGYNPVIYERQPKSAPEGIALALQPNGLRVLEMIPGLLPKISGCTVDTLQFYSIEPSDPGLLANTSIIAQLVQDGTIPYPWLTVARPHFHAVILAEAQEVYGIPVIYDHTLVGLMENNNPTSTADEGDGSVTVYFSNGMTDTASFVVGCDGLHSATRIALFGKEKAHFTGMTQMGGHSPKPADKTLWKGVTNIFGDGIHFICYPTSNQTIAWVITQSEGEAKETWKPMNRAGQDDVRNGPYSKLPYGAGELVRTCRQITKYGLYDRPELPTWYGGRVVLLGDAAHPTSPHLGQGANQAFEDVYHLARLLVKHNTPRGSVPSRFATVNSNNTYALSPTSSTSDEGRSHFVPTVSPAPAPAPSTEILTKVFEAYTNERLARTSALVHGARAQGEIRLVHGSEACIARNNKVRAIWHDQGVMVQGYAAVWKGSFEEDNYNNNNSSAEGEQLLKRMRINN